MRNTMKKNISKQSEMRCNNTNTGGVEFEEGLLDKSGLIAIVRLSSLDLGNDLRIDEIVPRVDPIRHEVEHLR